jgi:hypothetical protein
MSVRAKRLIYDVRAGEQRVEEFDFTPPPPPPGPVAVDLADLKKLMDYAKKMGWI